MRRTGSSDAKERDLYILCMNIYPVSSDCFGDARGDIESFKFLASIV